MLRIALGALCLTIGCTTNALPGAADSATTLDLVAPLVDLAVTPPDLATPDLATRIGCATTAGCPPLQACGPAGVCTAACDDQHLCNGGCCNAGVCVAGTTRDACGNWGGACFPCVATGGNESEPDCLVVYGQRGCGCVSDSSCPLYQSCYGGFAGVYCTAENCGGIHSQCNGGCCAHINGGGAKSCTTGMDDNECGGDGNGCVDCTLTGKHCVKGSCQ